MFGMEGDDDDCKYHVVWTIGSICQNTDIPVTVSVTLKGDGAGFPATASAGSPLQVTPGMEVKAEVFTTTPGDMDGATYCDDQSTHPAPGSEFTLSPVTGTAGKFSGNIKFDRAGQWTLRFHFHEECLDVLDDSPHGHAAFLVTVN